MGGGGGGGGVLVFIIMIQIFYSVTLEIQYKLFWALFYPIDLYQDIPVQRFVTLDLKTSLKCHIF